MISQKDIEIFSTETPPDITTYSVQMLQNPVKNSPASQFSSFSYVAAKYTDFKINTPNFAYY